MNLQKLDTILTIIIIVLVVTIFLLRSKFIDATSDNTTLQLSSTSFTSQSAIPSKHAYLFENISPQLSWDAGPTDTLSYAIVCQDPDAPRKNPWVHWIIFNIPATVQDLPEGLPQQHNIKQGEQGRNDYDKIGWDGPNPPSGTHRYVFKIYALNSMLPELQDQTPTLDKLMDAIKNHKILAQGELIGLYTTTE